MFGPSGLALLNVGPVWRDGLKFRVEGLGLKIRVKGTDLPQSKVGVDVTALSRFLHLAHSKKRFVPCDVVICRERGCERERERDRGRESV